MDLNCSNLNLTEAQVTSICVSRSTASALCLVVISLILLLLIFHKAHNSTLQRLFLYLTVMTTIQEACSMTLGIELHFESRGNQTFCGVVNFLAQTAALVVYFLTFGIFIYLPYMVYEQFSRFPRHQPSRSKCYHVAMECLFIFISVATPLTAIWVVDYRDFGAWCWLRTINDNCPTVGFQTLAYVFYGLTGVLGVVITIGLCVVLCHLAHKYRETRKQFMVTLCRTLVLLGFFIAIETLALNFLYTGSPYSVVYTAGLPVLQLIFPIAFLFYLYSLNMFHWKVVKKAAAEWRCLHSCSGRENLPDQEGATAPSSHPVIVPSISFFNVPHTGAFTNVTTERQTLVSDGGGGAGYGGAVGQQP